MYLFNNGIREPVIGKSEIHDIMERSCHCGCSNGCSEGCFPSVSVVNLDNGKSVTMSELQVGDKVQTGTKSVTMSEVKVGDKVQTDICY